LSEVQGVAALDVARSLYAASDPVLAGFGFCVTNRLTSLIGINRRRPIVIDPMRPFAIQRRIDEGATSPTSLLIRGIETASGSSSSLGFMLQRLRCS
jgi:hypothetical protein